MVLSPKTVMIAESESAELSYQEELQEHTLVEKEGGIFQKGIVLVGPGFQDSRESSNRQCAQPVITVF